ncbi:MAG: hypothetical protein E7620_04775 [Ruminococcaceae bacterium]|nr:hypothetical protein [Oscillospiraceae bacterium]
MKNLKRFFCALLLPALLFSCGAPSEEKPSAESTAPSDAPPTAEEPTVAPTEEETVPVKPLGKTIACVGDSITYGAHSTDYNTKSYPAVLQTLLGSEYTVTNYGFSGTSYVETERNYKPYDDCGMYRMSLAAKPETVVIMLGTNDTHDWAKAKERVEERVRALVEAYQALDSDPGIYLCTPIQRYDSPVYRGIIENELIPILKRVAKETGCVYVDLYAKTANIPQYYSDNLHMNDEGYAFLAQLVYSFLSEAIPLEK